MFQVEPQNLCIPEGMTYLWSSRARKLYSKRKSRSTSYLKEDQLWQNYNQVFLNCYCLIGFQSLKNFSIDKWYQIHVYNCKNLRTEVSKNYEERECSDSNGIRGNIDKSKNKKVSIFSKVDNRKVLVPLFDQTHLHFENWS